MHFKAIKYPGIIAALLVVLFLPNLNAQSVISLYVSKETGAYSKHSGSQSKSTDKYESGSVTLSTTGPIKYTVTPSTYSIGTEETKTWTGEIFPDTGAAPAPGSSADASITGNYDVKFSRPQGVGSGGTVLSTHQCYPTNTEP